MIRKPEETVIVGLIIQEAPRRAAQGWSDAKAADPGRRADFAS
jgi:hypothetical protein